MPEIGPPLVELGSQAVDIGLTPGPTRPICCSKSAHNLSKSAQNSPKCATVGRSRSTVDRPQLMGNDLPCEGSNPSVRVECVSVGVRVSNSVDPGTRLGWIPAAKLCQIYEFGPTLVDPQNVADVGRDRPSSGPEFVGKRVRLPNKSGETAQKRSKLADAGPHWPMLADFGQHLGEIGPDSRCRPNFGRNRPRVSRNTALSNGFGPSGANACLHSENSHGPGTQVEQHSISIPNALLQTHLM